MVWACGKNGWVSYGQKGVDGGTAEGGWFVIFRLFKSILFFVNWISLYFFHFLQNFTRLCLLLLYFDYVVIGRRDFFYSCQLYFFHTHASLLSVFVCLIVLFHSCCSRAWVFGKTLVHEFPVSYSHTEWYFLISLFGAREYKHAQRTLL